MADATGAAPARSCSTGRQTCCCYSRPKLAEDGGHAPQAVSGPICFRNSPGALVRFIFLKWLPQMDSHHHRRIQSPLSYCWTTGQYKW